MCIKIYYKVLLHSRKMQILATNLDTHMFRLIARIGFFLGWRGRKQIKLGYCWLPATRTISQPSQGTRGNTILLIVSCEGTRQTAKLLPRQHKSGQSLFVSSSRVLPPGSSNLAIESFDRLLLDPLPFVLFLASSHLLLAVNAETKLKPPR